jgi:DNA-binding GntR family transcriptional regulator
MGNEIDVFGNVSHPLSFNLRKELQKEILRGHLKKGEKLSEKQICEKYGVSRTPVRETFQQLELEGLIEIIPNRGAYVLGLSKRDIEDLFEMRKAYEILAVKWAIVRISKEERSKLEEAYEFMEFYTMKKDADKMLNINRQFHNLIYDASKNRFLKQSLSTFQFYFKETESNVTYPDKYLKDVLKEHRDIFDAFTNEDVKGGEIAMAMHLDNALIRANQNSNSH